MTAAEGLALGLLALIVGAMLPLLVQARATLRAWEKAAGSLDEVGATVRDLRHTGKVAAAMAAAIGPAFAAAARIMRAPSNGVSNKEEQS